MSEKKAPLQEHKFKFMGGSITLKPATTFMGKTGQVTLPDRIVMKIEGASMNLTLDAIEEMVRVYQAPAAKPFLEALREADNESHTED
jgi:hypothetical protein